jgi:hypothetical protein
MSPRFFVAPRTPIAAAGQSAERAVLLSSSGVLCLGQKQPVEFSRSIKPDLGELQQGHTYFVRSRFARHLKHSSAIARYSAAVFMGDAPSSEIRCE